MPIPPLFQGVQRQQPDIGDQDFRERVRGGGGGGAELQGQGVERSAHWRGVYETGEGFAKPFGHFTTGWRLCETTCVF